MCVDLFNVHALSERLFEICIQLIVCFIASLIMFCCWCDAIVCFSLSQKLSIEIRACPMKMKPLSLHEFYAISERNNERAREREWASERESERARERARNWQTRKNRSLFVFISLPWTVYPFSFSLFAILSFSSLFIRVRLKQALSNKTAKSMKIMKSKTK